MRRAVLLLALLLAACVVENSRGYNVRVLGPLHLDGAVVAIDGQKMTLLTEGDAEHPFREVLRQFLGQRRGFVSCAARVPKGAHTLRIEKEGFEPIERSVDVADPTTFTVVQVCAADVRPLK